MKKEDLTTRLLKLFFHIQGPFDECRQEIIYRACARTLDPNRLLLSPTLLVLSPIWTLHRVGARCHALPLFWTYLRPLI